jgi:colicin import membrane protein
MFKQTSTDPLKPGMHCRLPEFHAMGNRSLSALAGLIVLLAMPCSGLAADVAAGDDRAAAWQERLDKAEAMRAEGRARQDEADRLLEQRNTECARKFLINDCRNAAAREHLKTLRETRRLENDGRNIERAVKKEQMIERDRLRAEELPQHAANMELRQTESAAARQASKDKRAATEAGKAVKAAEGEKRKLAEAEKLRQKQADHDARVARKMQQAAQRAAQAAEKK